MVGYKASAASRVAKHGPESAFRHISDSSEEDFFPLAHMPQTTGVRRDTIDRPDRGGRNAPLPFLAHATAASPVQPAPGGTTAALLQQRLRRQANVTALRPMPKAPLLLTKCESGEDSPHRADRLCACQSRFFVMLSPCYRTAYMSLGEREPASGGQSI
ncbi:hypothetical protein BP5796_03306 [Coleophoma crateriformis]|uniref:Uncharacterized protein n=1 Tax=Coleophoma crateriformis TaxID=565419 RepID=A0A3D8SMV2_9HELO|nr:hypothetical protein BP5796_03306 [Coleophoma crateriformis]